MVFKGYATLCSGGRAFRIWCKAMSKLLTTYLLDHPKTSVIVLHTKMFLGSKYPIHFSLVFAMYALVNMKSSLWKEQKRIALQTVMFSISVMADIPRTDRNLDNAEPIYSNSQPLLWTSDGFPEQLPAVLPYCLGCLGMFQRRWQESTNWYFSSEKITGGISIHVLFAKLPHLHGYWHQCFLTQN